MYHWRPELKILFASGYSAGGAHNQFVLDTGLRLIQKPFAEDDRRSVRTIHGLVTGTRSTLPLRKVVRLRVKTVGKTHGAPRHILVETLAGPTAR